MSEGSLRSGCTGAYPWAGLVVRKLSELMNVEDGIWVGGRKWGLKVGDAGSSLRGEVINDVWKKKNDAFRCSVGRKLSRCRR